MLSVIALSANWRTGIS